MESLKDIENKLNNIARANNLTGDSVEFLIKLMSYTYFESLTSTRTAILEATPSRAVNLNSKIEHAMDQMYSINRGKNATLSVQATVTGNVSLKRFQQVYSDRQNNFYYSHVTLPSGEVVVGDYTFIYGLTYTLHLIKAEEIITQTLGVDVNNTFLLESLNNNISEDYTLKEDLLGSLSLVTTKDFGTHLDSSLSSLSEKKIFDLTTTNYGVRFYSPEIEGFNSSVQYNLTYVPYLQENVDMSNISKLLILGFELDHSTIQEEEYSSRESVENFIYNLRKEALTQSRVRSNDDVVDEFRSKFSTKLRDAIIGGYDLQNDILTINYIPFGSDAPIGTPSIYEITDVEKQNYIDSLLYYITQNIVFNPMYDHTNAVKYTVDINMFISQDIDISSITSSIQDLEYKLGGTFNTDELLGNIINLTGVRYATLEVKDEDGNPVTGSVTLDKDKYFLLSENFTYSFKI